MNSKLLGILIVWCLVPSAFKANAQQYYVNFDGDTIPGKLIIDTYHVDPEKMEFRNPYNNHIILTPYNAKSIYYSDKIVYQSVPFQDKQYFMQVIYKGALDVFFLIHGSELNAYVLLKSNNDAIEVNVDDYKSKIPDFLNDCSEIRKGMNNKEYKYRDKDFRKMAEVYENCVGNTTPRNKADIAIDNFKKEVDKSLQNTKEEIFSLLDTIRKKIDNKETVPDQMWVKLVGLVDGDKDLQKKAEMLKIQVNN